MVKKSSKKITILFLALLVFTTMTNISLARNNHTDIPLKSKLVNFLFDRATYLEENYVK